MERSKLKTIGRIAGTWIPALFLVFVFTQAGWAKMSDTSGWAVAFRHWEYPKWFRLTIGIMELAAAAFLLWGRTAVIGAALIVCVMLGAMGTHIAKDNGRHLTSEVVPLTLAIIILVVRRRQIARWIGRDEEIGA